MTHVVHPEQEYTLYCDGASRGNPGSASIGYALFDADGNEILGKGVYLGEKITNNVAEYESLLHGMRDAQQLGVRYLCVHMDSQLVVRQLLGQYRVRNAGLQPLFQAAQKARKSFVGFRIEHVAREDNSRADALANQALDALPSRE